MDSSGRSAEIRLSRNRKRVELPVGLLVALVALACAVRPTRSRVETGKGAKETTAQPSPPQRIIAFSPSTIEAPYVAGAITALMGGRGFLWLLGRR